MIINPLKTIGIMCKYCEKMDCMSAVFSYAYGACVCISGGIEE